MENVHISLIFRQIFMGIDLGTDHPCRIKLRLEVFQRAFLEHPFHRIPSLVILQETECGAMYLKLISRFP